MFDQQEQYEEILNQVFGVPVHIQHTKLIAAGTLNQAIYLDTDKGPYFLKTNFETTPDIFEKEAIGLNMLKKHTSLLLPTVQGFGKIQDLNYLLTDWISSRREVDDYWEKLAHGLAQIHMVSSKTFGLDHDNYIAILPQINTPHPSWPEFFIHQRLEPMLGKAYYDGLIAKTFLDKFRKIYPKLPEIFPSEIPALLHGDLWSGNVMISAKGEPALIDPAIYFGHREVDLAFSKLFGGFNDKFYHAYEEVFPMEPGFEERVRFYNLYPLLVHLNLFGKSYLGPIENTIKSLIG